MTWALCATTLVDVVHAGVEDAPSTAHVVYPEGTPPQAGWPVFVLLHGYGTNKHDFEDLCDVVASRGAVAVALDAPHVLRDARRSWGRANENANVHAYVQEQTAFLRDDARFDTHRLHLGGFSQGAMHAVLLVLAWPEHYGGVLAVSSPGSAPLPDDWDPGAADHPLFIVYGQQEPEHVATFADRLARRWDASKQRHQTFRHPGGHTFPLFWERILAGAVDWILTPAP